MALRRETSVPLDGARRTARGRRLDGGMDVLVARMPRRERTAHEKLFAVEHRRYTEFELLCG